jgi:hypothetical protein
MTTSFVAVPEIGGSNTAGGRAEKPSCAFRGTLAPAFAHAPNFRRAFVLAHYPTVPLFDGIGWIRSAIARPRQKAREGAGCS